MEGRAASAWLALLRRANRHVAHAAGIAYLGAAGLVVTDIVLRRLGSGLGGTDEIAGYVMAIATAWGLSWALVERAHVRIDAARGLLGGRGRALMDLLALTALSGVALYIAYACWPVLSRSLTNASRANTPLETPLAWVQAPWMAGWVWFALSCAALLVIAAMRLRDPAAVEDAAGIGSETE